MRAAPESSSESSSSCRAVGSKWVAETKIGGRELRSSEGLVVVVVVWRFDDDGGGDLLSMRGIGEDEEAIVCSVATAVLLSR